MAHNQRHTRRPPHRPVDALLCMLCAMCQMPCAMSVHMCNEQNSEELWHIINDTPDAHPIHLHLIMLRPLARRPFNRTAYCNSQCAFPGNSSANSSLPTCFTGEGSSVRVSGRAGSVGEYERGWKDTTVLQRDEVLTLWTGWFSQDGSPFPFNPTRGPGYVWHCHILEHEDNDMMRPLIVT
ncbi:unnamed protein product [Closterium sp. NIES-54]